LFFSPRPEPKGDNIGFCASGNKETRSDRTQEEESRSAHEESRSAATPLLEQPLVIEGKRRRVTRSAAEGGSTAQTYGYSNTAVSESRLGSLDPKQLTPEQVDAYLDSLDPRRSLKTDQSRPEAEATPHEKGEEQEFPDDYCTVHFTGTMPRTVALTRT
ncbi:hypothetical protein THAOC_05916, partial [Thalassiosira oceanica]